MNSLILFIWNFVEYHSQKALVEKLQEKKHHIVWIKLLSTEPFELVSRFFFLK